MIRRELVITMGHHFAVVDGGAAVMVEQTKTMIRQPTDWRRQQDFSKIA
jgi:hypothetical protein